MKKMFCLWFVVCGLMYGQIKPFGFWEIRWMHRNVNPLPANFSAEYLSAENKIILTATVFPDATNIEQIRVRAKVDDCPVDETTDLNFLEINFTGPSDTTLVQNAVSIYAPTRDRLFCITLWVKENGKPFYGFAKQIYLDVDYPD